MSDPLAILKRLVIGWDADQDDEFIEAMADARALLGFVLDTDGDDVLTRLQPAPDHEDEEADMDEEARRQ
jgi:hypothetical protein